MKLFAKNRADKLTGRQEVLAGRIAAHITRTQRRTADWLNCKTARLPAKTWFLLLVLFCSCFGAYCLYLLIAAFN